MITYQPNTSFTDTTDMAALRQQFELFLQSMGAFQPSEIKLILDRMRFVQYPKGSFILREGQVSHENYMLMKGCIREFQYRGDEENTMTFYTEGDSVTSALSYMDQVPAKHSWECLEDCVLTASNREEEAFMNALLKNTDAICRERSEAAFGEYQERVAEFVASTPEQRYLHIQDRRPDLLERVPQYYLASYIGVSPETLSRIRSRLRGKRKEMPDTPIL
jgi:CRP-like cAMP-binding protein